MSDEEEVHSEEEEEEEEESRQDTGPSEAELAMQRRRDQAKISSSGLDEAAQELLEQNRLEREAMDAEIKELRARNERRKRERQEEEKRLAEQRAEEEQRRRAEEEERRRRKEEEEQARREERAAKMAEFEKWKNPPKPNFVITKKEGASLPVEDEDESGPKEEKKSREQLEAEKQAILAQRIHPINIDSMGDSELQEQAKHLHKEILRLEGEKYDLEKRFKEQQYDMMELAERARQMNKVGKGGLKRVQMAGDEEWVDKIQERFAGAPAKIEMYSKYERQKDKRNYSDRHTVFHGPTWKFPAERIRPSKRLLWGDDGLPLYEEMEGGAPPPAEEEAPAEE